MLLLSTLCFQFVRVPSKVKHWLHLSGQNCFYPSSSSVFQRETLPTFGRAEKNYTHMLLHRAGLTHRCWKFLHAQVGQQRRFCTQTRFRTEVFTQRSRTQEYVLHTGKALAQKLLHREAVAQGSFDTMTFLHTKAFTQRNRSLHKGKLASHHRLDVRHTRSPQSVAHARQHSHFTVRLPSCPSRLKRRVNIAGAL